MSGPVRSARDYAAASLRDLATRYFALIDAGVRARLGGQLLALDQALDRLAVSEAINRQLRDGRQVDILAALNAGASWKNVAYVLDAPEAALRQEFHQWVDGQRVLYEAAQDCVVGRRRLGMSPRHAEAVLRLDADTSQPPKRDLGRN